MSQTRNTYIVSGGASELGASMARHIHSRGCHVVISDLDLPGAQRIAAQLGEGAMAIACDIRDDGDIENLVATTAARFGRLDGLVNNAVTYTDSGITSSRAEWLEALDVNLVGGARLLSCSIEWLERSPCASVVNVASIAAKHAQRGRALYPCSKRALIQLTQAQAVELAEKKIRVNSVSPAWTWSRPIQEACGGDRAHADLVAAKVHPLGRVADQNEVARAVWFLLSDESSFTTGSDLPVDGGHSTLGPDAGQPIQGELRKP